MAFCADCGKFSGKEIYCAACSAPSAPEEPTEERSRAASPELDLAAPVVLPVVAGEKPERDLLAEVLAEVEQFGAQIDWHMGKPLCASWVVKLREVAALACPGEKLRDEIGKVRNALKAEGLLVCLTPRGDTIFDAMLEKFVAALALREGRRESKETEK